MAPAASLGGKIARFAGATGSSMPKHALRRWKFLLAILAVILLPATILADRIPFDRARESFVSPSVSATNGGGPYHARAMFAVTPEPASLVLFGTCLACFAGAMRRRLKRQ
jgi:PEP-CTERM motif